MEESQELIAAREEVAAMVERAHAAQAQIAHYNQEQVNELITAMVWAVAREDRSEEIARFTVNETQLGNYEGKYLKIHRKEKERKVSSRRNEKDWKLKAMMDVQGEA